MSEAGFETYDVHMTDLQLGRTRLDMYQGFVACGGFSYGDTLGAGEGWARSIRFNAQLADQFAAFFARSDTFALGVCNGCQMMAALAPMIPGAQDWPQFTRNKSEQFEAFFQRPDSFALGICNGCQMFAALQGLIPGTQHWPRFVTNRSEQYESRFALVEVLRSPSVVLDGMAGSVLPIAVAHGEGFAEFASAEAADKCAQSGLIGYRYINNDRTVAKTYPANPNGSPYGIAALSNADGRVMITMLYPERSFRYVQNSWWPSSIPWMTISRGTAGPPSDVRTRAVGRRGCQAVPPAASVRWR